jgi:hypothetical protein
MNWLCARCVGYGILIGTAGVKILASDDAKKVYTNVTAAVLRGVDSIAETYENIKENCEDIVSDAKLINRDRYEAKEAKLIEDAKAVLKAEKEKQAE